MVHPVCGPEPPVAVTLTVTDVVVVAVTYPAMNAVGPAVNATLTHWPTEYVGVEDTTKV